MRSFAVWYKEKKPTNGSRNTQEARPKDEAAKDEATKSEAAKDEVAKDEATKSETAKDEVTKDGATKSETAKDEGVKDEATKSETVKDEGVKAQVHINLWEQNICKNKNSLVNIDIGLMIDEMSRVDGIYIYCPVEIELDHVEDLGERIIDNQKLVGAIFNDNYPTRSSFARRLSVEAPDRGSFVIYRVDVPNDISIQHKEGTLLYINTTDILASHDKGSEKMPEKYYFRIRIRVEREKLSMMFYTRKILSPFQDAFVTTQVIDFRLNNLRSCEPLIRDEFAKGAHFRIYAVHYLLLRNATDIFIHQGGDVSSRLLEKELWETYIEGLRENIIAYHFKKMAASGQNINDFGVLTRFEFKSVDGIRLFYYIYVAIFFGVISGVGANCLDKSPDECIWLFGGAVGCVFSLWRLSHK